MKYLYTLKLHNTPRRLLYPIALVPFLAILSKLPYILSAKNNKLGLLKLLFVVFLINNISTVQAQRTFTICPGEEVLLNDFTVPPLPPLPPVGQPNPIDLPSIDGLPYIPPLNDIIPSCNFTTKRIITPTNGLLKEKGKGYVVAPSSTATYTVESRVISVRTTPPDPGVSPFSLCLSGVPVVDEFTVIVEDCEPVEVPILNSLTIDYETEYNLCYGDTLQTSSPPMSPVYIYTETTSLHPTPSPLGNLPLSTIWYYQQYNCPSYNQVEVIPNKNWQGLYPSLFPSVTTEYLITHRITNDPNCNSNFITKIKVNVVCSAKNNAIAKDYPWLATLTNNDACEFSSIEVYEKNNLKYICINSTDGKNLYFQNGTMLCQDSPNYDCVEAYQLANLVKSWSCDQPSGNTANAEQQIFNNYNWLSNIIDQDNCNDEAVTVYDAGSYEFVLIQNTMGDRLYDATGKFYCFSSTGFSFLAGYDTSQIIDSWACEVGFQGRESTPIIQDQGIQIFPNPATNKVFINLQELVFEQSIISIYDVKGKQMLQTTSADAFAGIA